MDSITKTESYCSNTFSTYNIDLVDLDIVNMVISLLNTTTNQQLKYVKILDKGTFGTILLFQDTKTDEHVVLKQTTSEQEWVNLADLKTKKCNQVDAIPFMKIIKPLSPNYEKIWYFILMPFYSGNLQTIISNIQLSHVTVKLELFQQIVQQVTCLYNYGYYYIDMKPANILFLCSDPNKFTVSLGDLGSLVKKGEHGNCTYSPFMYREANGVVIGDDQSVVWGLCVLLLFLFIDSDIINKYFLWSNIVNKSYNADILGDVILQVKNHDIINLIGSSLIFSSVDQGLTVNEFNNLINNIKLS